MEYLIVIAKNYNGQKKVEYGIVKTKKNHNNNNIM